jgi:lysophospholipase L1-like esterase
MFYEDEYRAYLVRLRELAAEQDARFADLADAVPAGQWGYWIDGPDPIHFDEQGHQTMARRLSEAFGADLLAAP